MDDASIQEFLSKVVDLCREQNERSARLEDCQRAHYELIVSVCERLAKLEKHRAEQAAREIDLDFESRGFYDSSSRVAERERAELPHLLLSDLYEQVTYSLKEMCLMLQPNTEDR